MTVRRSAYLSFATRNAGMLINFAATLVIARLLTPSEIGVFAIAAAFVTISQIIRDSGIGSYLIQERELTREHIRTAMGVGLVMGAVLSLAIILSAAPLARFYGDPGVEGVLHLLVFSFLLAPVNAIGLALLRRDLAFGVTFGIETTSNLVWAGVAVALAYHGFSYYSMAWASVAATTTICILFLVFRRDCILIRPSLAEWRRVLDFSSIVTLSQVLANAGVYAPAFTLGRFVGLEAVAFYNRGNSLTRMFRDTIERGAAVVALPAFAADLRRGGFNTRSFCYATEILTGLFWPFFCLLAIVAYPVVRILFGDQWDAAVPVVQMLAIAQMMRGPVLLVPEVTIAHGAVRLGLKREALIQTTRVLVIVLVASHGVLAVATSQIAVTAFAMLVNQRILRKLVRLSALDLASACVRSAAVTAATAIGPGLAVTIWPPTPEFLWPPLLLAATGAATGWLIAVAVLDHPLLGEMAILFRKTRSALSAERA